VLELWYDTFTYVLAFLFVLGVIPRQSIQDGDPTPLGTFVEGDEKFVENGGGNNEYARVRRGSRWL
jgi:hypothetical protein